MGMETRNGHTPTADRLPPQNDDAECCVLGSILRDNDCLTDVQRWIGPDSFRTDRNAKVFRAILDLLAAGIPADSVTLANRLHDLGQIEDVGYPFIGELLFAAPTSANAEYYAQIVREKWLARSLVHLGSEVVRDAYDQALPGDEMLDAAEAKLFALRSERSDGKPVTLEQAMSETCLRIDGRRGDRPTGLPTGFLDLDELTSGLQPSETFLIAARPSVGKSILALSIAIRIVRQGVPALFLSLEMPRCDLCERLLACEANVHGQQLRKGMIGREEAERIIEASRRLSRYPLWIDDTAGQDMFRIAAVARRLVARSGIQAVFVDYLQLIQVPRGRENREQQVAGISQRMKHLARELKIPVVVLCQLNRGVENRGDPEPKLSDLRESGQLENDADSVLMLYRLPAEDDVICASLAKQRNGPTGKFRLTFERQYQRLSNHAQADPRFEDS